MRYALIDNGVVSNLILWDGETIVDFGSATPVICEDFEVGVGWVFNNGKFSAPVEVK